MNITIGISMLSLLISGCAAYYARSTILKNDLRGKLAINWAIYKEKNEIIYKRIYVSLNEQRIYVRVPQLRIYVNSGSIQRTYMLFPYPITGNKEHPYKKFEALHVSLGNSIDTVRWSPTKQKKVVVCPGSFEALCLKENGGSTYMMHLILGTDRSYHLIMLVYKNIASGTATLEVFDKVDCLNYYEKNNHIYIDQFQRCIDYLRENHIEVV